MSELSRDEVVAILGPRISDALAAEVIATGITPVIDGGLGGKDGGQIGAGVLRAPQAG